MIKFLRRFGADNRGATAIEYALIVALITLASVLGMQAVGLSLSKFYTNLSQQMNEMIEK